LIDDLRRNPDLVYRGLFHFALHLLLGIPGSILICLCLSGASGWVQWFNPVYWIGGLFLGFVVDLRFRHRSACFVWLLGLMWLASATKFFELPYPDWIIRMAHSQRELFPLRGEDCNRGGCLGFGLITLPVLNSASYSVGAALALLLAKANEDRESSEQV